MLQESVAGDFLAVPGTDQRSTEWTRTQSSVSSSVTRSDYSTCTPEATPSRSTRDVEDRGHGKWSAIHPSSRTYPAKSNSNLKVLLSSSDVRSALNRIKSSRCARVFMTNSRQSFCRSSSYAARLLSFCDSLVVFEEFFAVFNERTSITLPLSSGVRTFLARIPLACGRLRAHCLCSEIKRTSTSSREGPCR